MMMMMKFLNSRYFERSTYFGEKMDGLLTTELATGSRLCILRQPPYPCLYYKYNTSETMRGR